MVTIQIIKAANNVDMSLFSEISFQNFIPKDFFSLVINFIYMCKCSVICQFINQTYLLLLLKTEKVLSIKYHISHITLFIKEQKYISLTNNT